MYFIGPYPVVGDGWTALEELKAECSDLSILGVTKGTSGGYVVPGIKPRASDILPFVLSKVTFSES